MAAITAALKPPEETNGHNEYTEKENQQVPFSKAYSPVMVVPPGEQTLSRSAIGPSSPLSTILAAPFRDYPLIYCLPALNCVLTAAV